MRKKRTHDGTTLHNVAHAGLLEALEEAHKLAATYEPHPPIHLDAMDLELARAERDAAPDLLARVRTLYPLTVRL